MQIASLYVNRPKSYVYHSLRIINSLVEIIELTPKKDVLFIIGLECKMWKSRDTWSNRQIGLGVQNEVGQMLTEFFQENALVIANTLVQQHKRRIYTWTSPDGQY